MFQNVDQTIYLDNGVTAIKPAAYFKPMVPSEDNSCQVKRIRANTSMISGRAGGVNPILWNAGAAISGARKILRLGRMQGSRRKPLVELRPVGRRVVLPDIG